MYDIVPPKHQNLQSLLWSKELNPSLIKIAFEYRLDMKVKLLHLKREPCQNIEIFQGRMGGETPVPYYIRKSKDNSLCQALSQSQTILGLRWKMEDDLNFSKKEDNLDFFKNGR